MNNNRSWEDGKETVIHTFAWLALQGHQFAERVEDGSVTKKKVVDMSSDRGRNLGGIRGEREAGAAAADGPDTRREYGRLGADGPPGNLPDRPLIHVD